ncbi:MAG: hypothetical protein P1V51_05295 [Deltaproteobacteria bacterium]|nr:hypothetical protein [Deltaproteobacteria bacterium]
MVDWLLIGGVKRMQLQSKISPGVAVAVLGTSVLLATACGRDFALPVLVDTPVLDLLVEPEILRPGQTLSISFRPLVEGTPTVTVNGRPANRADPLAHLYTYTVEGTEGEVLTVQVAFPGGESATGQAFVDAVPPEAAATADLLLEMRPRGSNDLLSAVDGAFAGDVARVVISADAAGEELLATVVPSSGGGFTGLSVGDNSAALLHVLAEDAVGNRSPPTVIPNDIAAPAFTALRLSPDPPRSGAPFRIEIESDPDVASADATYDRGGALAEAALALEGGAWGVELGALDYTGPATLSLELIDAAGNPARQELSLEVAPPAALDEAAIRLRRTSPDAPTWEVLGLPGAAPAGTELAVSLLVVGSSWAPQGTALVGPDGAFPAVALDRDLAPSDTLGLEVRLPGTSTKLVSTFLSPDRTRPGLASTPAGLVGGPAAPIQVTFTTSEPVVDGVTLVTAVAPARRTDPGGETTAPAFEYLVPPSHPDGALEATLTLIDRANNVGVVLLDLVADTTGPAVSFDWSEPLTPPTSLLPPPDVTATITDGHAAVASVSYRAFRVDLGQWWSGTGYDAPAPVDHPIALAALPDWRFWLRDQGRPAGEPLLDLPINGRIRIFFDLADTVGNTSRHTFTASRYASADVFQEGSGRGWLSAAALAGPVACAVGRSYESAGGAYDPGGGSFFLLGSSDHGVTWSRKPTPVAVTGESPYPTDLALDDLGARGVVVGSDGLVLTLRAGCSADAVIDLGLQGKLAAATWEGDTAWIAGDDGVFRGDQGGTLWTPVLDWPRFTGIVRLGPGRLLASTASGAFHRSTDGGATWSAHQVLTPTQEITALTADDDGIAYAGGAGFLLESHDGGQSWAPVAMPLNMTDYGVWQTWQLQASGTRDGFWALVQYQMENTSNPASPYVYTEWWFASRAGGPWLWMGNYGDGYFRYRRSSVLMFDTYRGWLLGFDDQAGEPVVLLESTVSGGPQGWRWWP